MSTALSPASRHLFITAGCLAGLLGGAVAAVLPAGAAKAAGSFSMQFLGATGSTGTMAFDFTNGIGTDDQYTMKVDITNTTGALPLAPGGATSSVLTAFAISFPDTFVSILPDVTYGYNPLNSPFTNVEVGKDAKIGSLGTFDICAISKDGGNCNGAGSANDGLPSSPSSSNRTAVQFTFAYRPNSGSANPVPDVSAAFQEFIKTSKDPAVAMRWQSVTGSVIGTSDKVGGTICTPGTPYCTPPGGGPGDEVPGPVPLLGAAAAFGYSRRIRRRITAGSRNSSSQDSLSIPLLAEPTSADS